MVVDVVRRYQTKRCQFDPTAGFRLCQCPPRVDSRRLSLPASTRCIHAQKVVQGIECRDASTLGELETHCWNCRENLGSVVSCAHVRFVVECTVDGIERICQGTLERATQCQAIVLNDSTYTCGDVPLVAAPSRHGQVARTSS